MAFPGVSDSKASLQSGRPRLDPWVGKIHRRRARLPTAVLLPGESHGWRSLVGYRPWSCRVGHNWATLVYQDLTGEWPRGTGQCVRTTPSPRALERMDASQEVAFGLSTPVDTAPDSQPQMQLRGPRKPSAARPPPSGRACPHRSRGREGDPAGPETPPNPLLREDAVTARGHLIL